MMIDETYDKYVTIVYNWSNTKKTYSTVRVYSTRHEMYGEQEFYVLGIGTSKFLEANGYDPKKDWVNDENLNPDTDYNPKELLKYHTCNAWISIDDLYELSNLLKEAGAKEVYLHPSYWTDNKALLDHYTPDEWLIVIPKEK